MNSWYIKIVKIKKFKALLYNKDKVEINKVTSNIDDVSLEIKKEYREDKFNINFLLDTKLTSSHKDAQRFLKNWLDKDIIFEDNDEAYYLYEHCFIKNETPLKLLGIFVSIQLDEENQKDIFFHEKTLDGPYQNRLKLFSKCQCQLSPIYALYDDKNKILENDLDQLRKTQAFYEVENKFGIYKFWKIKDNNIVSSISNFFLNKKIYIADGHHRYQALRKLYQKNECNEGMFLLVNGAQKSVMLDAIHRGVKNISRDQIKFLEANIEKYFLLEKCKNLKELKLKISQKKSNIGWVNKENIYYCLSLNPEMIHLFKNKRTAINTSQEIFESIIFKLSFSTKTDAENQVLSYYKDENSLNRDVMNNNLQSGFIMNKVSMECLFTKAERGEVLPAKSTFFYPKILNGFALKKLKN